MNHNGIKRCLRELLKALLRSEQLFFVSFGGAHIIDNGEDGIYLAVVGIKGGIVPFAENYFTCFGEVAIDGNILSFGFIKKFLYSYFYGSLVFGVCKLL